MQWLNYHHLLYFWQIAREGSLRGASEKLRVSQPSISAQVHVLEDALGHKLFTRQGRNLVLTESGQIVFGYADEIFSLGTELQQTLGQGKGNARIKLRIGIEDSFPKLLSFKLLKPMMENPFQYQVICREGKAEDLIAQLALHRLDVVVADQPASSSVKIKVFSHFIGESGTTIVGTEALARRLRRGFPNSLNGAPAILPTPNTTLRRGLDEWFLGKGIRPEIVGEFEDSGLLKIVAQRGIGFTAVPTATVKEVRERFALHRVGDAPECRDCFYLITAERRMAHPALTELHRTASGLLAGN